MAKNNDQNSAPQMNSVYQPITKFVNQENLYYYAEQLDINDSQAFNTAFSTWDRNIWNIELGQWPTLK